MSNRRKFLKTSLALSAGVVALSDAPTFATVGGYPDGIIYTKDNQGKWEGKSDSHAPIVKINGDKITVETKHGMSEKHYIVRHTVVSETGEVLGEKTFYPSDKKAISTFTVKRKQTVLYATSFCNKHDLWVTKFSKK